MKETWENLKETSYIHIFKLFSNFYSQFVDDIFLLWNGSEAQLLDFVTTLNSRQPKIQFIFKYSKSSIQQIGEIFRSYLSTPKTNPIKKICSETWELNRHLKDKFKELFINHGYQEKVFTEQINQVSQITREALLT